MSISLYELTVPSYLQLLDALGAIMTKGAEHAAQGDLSLADIEDTRLYEDMLPFSFQIISAMHHSRGAIEGLKAGLFQPPPDLQLDYAGLQELISQAAQDLRGLSEEEVNALQGKSMLFKAGEFEIPFTGENFLISFSLPNFYFHVTTAYDILRMLGVHLGKLDFLGQMRMGA